jgi:hypothetical protein
MVIANIIFFKLDTTVSNAFESRDHKIQNIVAAQLNSGV